MHHYGVGLHRNKKGRDNYFFRLDRLVKRFRNSCPGPFKSVSRITIAIALTTTAAKTQPAPLMMLSAAFDKLV